MTKDDLIGIGFVPVPNFTVLDSVTYQLGRNRHLSAGAVGTANEILWICGTDSKDERVLTDLVCLHNYDYDGPLTIEKVKTIINAITGSKL